MLARSVTEVVNCVLNYLIKFQEIFNDLSKKIPMKRFAKVEEAS